MVRRRTHELLSASGLSPHCWAGIRVQGHKFYRFEVNKLEPAKDVLGIYSVDEVHMTLEEDLQVEKLLPTQRR